MPRQKKRRAKSAFLRRYTDIPALLYLLRHRKLALVDPKKWEDTNDSYFLALYGERKKLKTVLAACFTQTGERYHHWQVFADGPGGVCIVFNRRRLLKCVNAKKGTTANRVKYLEVKKLRKLRKLKKLWVDDLPFLKRWPYSDEREFRVIYQSSRKTLDILPVPISLRCIDRIILSPWIASALADDLKETLRSIRGCNNLKITNTTLISNETWKKAGDGATKRPLAINPRDRRKAEAIAALRNHGGLNGRRIFESL